MHRRSIVALSSALIAWFCVGGAGEAAAFDLQISEPVAGSNLSVYFVDGPPGGGAAIMSLDEAVAKGAARIYQQPAIFDSTRHLFMRGPVAIENLSAQSIFVQMGTLVSGGLQDQVVIRSIVVPPGSGRVSIDTMCVDPFRSTARDGESAASFSAPGSLFPWRMARLSALAANSPTAALDTRMRDVRQLGIWWSMDSIRVALARKLGVPLEPAKSPTWSYSDDESVNTQLAARSSNWRNSLPLSLQNPELARAEQLYVDALQARGEQRDTIVGAIFVINGHVEGAEIYNSHALFAAMWPKLLRAYAVQAIAVAGDKPRRLPSVGHLREVLDAAEHSPATDLGFGNRMHETAAGIYATVASGEGAPVYRSYVPKHRTDRLTPEGAIVNILDAGMVDGRAITSIDTGEVLVMRPDAAGQSYVGSVVRTPTKPVRTDRIAAVTSDTLFSDRWIGVEHLENARSWYRDFDMAGMAAMLVVFALISVLVSFAVRPPGGTGLRRRALARLTAISKRLGDIAFSRLRPALARISSPQSEPPPLPSCAPMVVPPLKTATDRRWHARVAGLRRRAATAKPVSARRSRAA